jgi:hypothetical protein
MSTYSDDLVLCTGGEEQAVGAEAHTPDVQVTVFGQTAILEMRNRVASVDIENLRGAVAACCHIPAVHAEAYTADDTLMRKVVDKVDVQDTPGARVEDGEPIAALLLQVLWQLLNVEIGKDVALRHRDLVLGHQGSLWVVRRRGRPRHLGRTGIGRWVVLLRSGRPSRRTARARTLSAGRGCRLRRLSIT